MMIDGENLQSDEQSRMAHRQWIGETISKGLVREPQWRQRITVGGEAFVQRVFRKLKRQAVNPESSEAADQNQLREDATPYSAHFVAESDALSHIVTHISTTP